MGWSDGFDLLWNCVMLYKWVYVCTGLPICGITEWIWWGSTPQCPARMGFHYGGQLIKHMYLLVKGLVAFGLVCHLGTQNHLLWNLSVVWTWDWLLASVWALLPQSLCASGIRFVVFSYNSTNAFKELLITLLHPYRANLCMHQDPARV